MTATLYLPPGYDKARDGPLPCILWAYPREFKSREAAGQMRRSPHQFAGGQRRRARCAAGGRLAPPCAGVPGAARRALTHPPCLPPPAAPCRAGVGGTAPTLWLTRGYAVLDGPTFPIIADGEGAEPNDTYIEQLTASAKVRRGSCGGCAGRGLAEGRWQTSGVEVAQGGVLLVDAVLGCCVPGCAGMGGWHGRTTAGGAVPLLPAACLFPPCPAQVPL
jgi:hypothetical protein